MDLSSILKYYNKEQKNVFTGFAIQLPLTFTLLYLYIPQFKELEIYLQFIFASTASILSIYHSFLMLILCQILAKKEYSSNIILPILPLLLSSFILIRQPEMYSLGYKHILDIYFKCSTSIFCPIAIWKLILRKLEEYDKKHYD